MLLKVVYIDDEPEICKAFEENVGYSSDIEVKTFVDPEVGLMSIKADPPDLNILGFKVAEDVRP